MIFGLFKDYGAKNSGPVFAAFEQGIQKLGHTAVGGHMDMPDVAVIWSVLWNGSMSKNHEVWEHFTKQGKPVIVLEVGGMIRNSTWKVGIGGINSEAYFGHDTDNTSDRLRKMKIKIQPWRLKSYQPRYILICGQHEKSHQWRNMPPMQDWIVKTISEIRQYTDRDIRVRPHPRSPLDMKWTQQVINDFNDVYFNQPRHISGSYDDYDYEKQLTDAWCVVNWSSNPASQAALNGIPVFTGPQSLAAPISNQRLARIEDPDMPDRQQWANDLMYTEWFLEEIAAGEPLKRLLPKLEELTQKK